MGHVVIHLTAAIGSTRDFILEKKSHSIVVSYSTLTVPSGGSQLSLSQFTLNDLFSLIQEIYGLDVRLFVEKHEFTPEVKKKLET